MTQESGVLLIILYKRARTTYTVHYRQQRLSEQRCYCIALYIIYVVNDVTLLKFIRWKIVKNAIRV